MPAALTVSNTDHGQGVFATADIRRGRRIAYFEGYKIDHPTQYSLTLDGTTVEPTGQLKYLNHSCAANAHFLHRWLIASGDIHPGEEITIDYLATEKSITHHFLCTCGAATCRGWI